MKQETRLHHLEQRARSLAGDPLVVLYKTPDGAEHKGNVSDMIQAGGNLVRVLTGGNLADVDRILAAFLKDVMEG